MKALLLLALTLPTLGACDAVKDRMGIPIPEKVEAEGKAIGSACRHAGRGLEDCFRLNPGADKAAVHTGWKEMNEYMIKNSMQAITPEFPASLPGKKPAAHADEEEGADAPAEKPAVAHADGKEATGTAGHAPEDKQDAAGADPKPAAGKAEAKAGAHAQTKVEGKTAH